MASKAIKYDNLKSLLAFLHESYGKSDASILTSQALQLKFSINMIMDEIKEFLPEEYKEIVNEQ